MIETIVDKGHNLTIHKCIGTSTEEEYINANKLFYTGNPTEYRLWDFTEANLLSITSEFIRRLSMLVCELNTGKRKTGRTAVIASQDLEFGLARMFQSLYESEDTAIDIRIFRTAEEARGWLFS